MPTHREIRALKKIEMAKRREIKKRKKELREQGLVDFEGEIIPLKEARRRWGQKGAVHGIKGAKHGIKGGNHGIKGGNHGVKGATHRVKGATHGVKGATHGVKEESHVVKVEIHVVKVENNVVKVESHVVKAKSHEIKGATHQVKAESHGVKVESLWVKGESHEIKWVSSGLIESVNGNEQDIEGKHQFKKINRLGYKSKKFKSKNKVRDVYFPELFPLPQFNRISCEIYQRKTAIKHLFPAVEQLCKLSKFIYSLKPLFSKMIEGILQFGK